MPVFTLQFERYEQQTASVEVQARDLDEAIVAARAMHDVDADWEPTHHTEPRLYAVADGQGDTTLATVRLPDFTTGFCWTSVDLREQWGRVRGGQASSEELRQIVDLLSRYFDALTPQISDAGRAELDAERLRSNTSSAGAHSDPVASSGADS